MDWSKNWVNFIKRIQLVFAYLVGDNKKFNFGTLFNTLKFEKLV